MQKRVLSQSEIAESFRFGNGALAAAEHFVTIENADSDLLDALSGAISFDEAVRRAKHRALSRPGTPISTRVQPR